MLELALAVAATVAPSPTPEPDCLPPRKQTAADKKGERQGAKDWGELVAKVRTFGVKLIAFPEEQYQPADLPPTVVPAIVGVQFVLGPNGRATDCTIIQASGTATLDAAGCALVLNHVVSQPAMKNGAPVASTVRIAIVWGARIAPVERRVCSSSGGAIAIVTPALLPSFAFADLYMPRNAAVAFRLDVSETGVPVACTIVQAKAPRDLQDRLCAVSMRTLHFLPATNAAGDFVATSVRRVVRFHGH